MNFRGVFLFFSDCRFRNVAELLGEPSLYHPNLAVIFYDVPRVKFPFLPFQEPFLCLLGSSHLSGALCSIFSASLASLPTPFMVYCKRIKKNVVPQKEDEMNSIWKTIEERNRLCIFFLFLSAKLFIPKKTNGIRGKGEAIIVIKK